MGYIIPIQPYQSQIYANRMLMDDYNFAYVSNVQGIKMKPLFENHLAELQEKEISDEQQDKELLERQEPSIPPLYKSFIHPNPVNLSPIIAEISGKGNNVNVYI